MPRCYDCFHEDFLHDESHPFEKNKGCKVCNCKNFKADPNDTVSRFAKRIGYNNKWKMIRSFIWDGIAIILILYLAQLTSQVTCVSGDIPLDIYNQCIQDFQAGQFENVTLNPLPV